MDRIRIETEHGLVYLTKFADESLAIAFHAGQLVIPAGKLEEFTEAVKFLFLSTKVPVDLKP